jgi:bifunctional polynucleotide phosphatase/kinase
MIGPPASGKSTRSKLQFPSHVYVNQDTLKTKQKCISTAREALSQKLNVVVDNTNSTSESRREWIRLADEHGAAVSN